MKKVLLLSAIIATQTFANPPKVLVDETFTATFSHDNRLDELLTCHPGFRGPFATQDQLELNSQVLDMGLSVDSSDKFRASSSLGMNREGRNVTQAMDRPFSEGCQLAIDAIKAEIAGQEIITVTVHRKVTSTPDVRPRVRRKVNGEVISSHNVTSELIFEQIRFELADVEFTLARLINGRTIHSDQN